MFRHACLFLLIAFTGAAHAWNAAGHRLVAVIAWQQMSPAAQAKVADILVRHPDHERWVASARSSTGAAIAAEASTWPDDIRGDPRFYDEEREPATPLLAGFSDMARHKTWHYVDLDERGRVQAGELDSRIARLVRTLAEDGKPVQKAYALPWLLHLVADIHQPLHVGRHGDEGGNSVDVENPYNPRLPFSSLHLYWDDLPGPPWLRGERLDRAAAALLLHHPAPKQGGIGDWREESHRLLDDAYPKTEGSLLPIIDERFHQASRDTANRRVVEAGYRLGRLLERLFGEQVSRETQRDR